MLSALDALRRAAVARGSGDCQSRIRNMTATRTRKPAQRRDVADAQPFDVIARKFATSPETLAFSLLDPHPRMNVPLTRRGVQDIAAYINTLAK